MRDLALFYRQLLDHLTRKRLEDDQNYDRCFSAAGRWTRFMLGNAGNRESGAIGQALRDCWPSCPTFSHERYGDLVVFAGEWRRGESITHTVLEHENNFKEFEGTISDLLRHEARKKIAIFYAAAISRDELQIRLNNVFEYFLRQGFLEAADTEYLIVVGPLRVPSAGIGEWPAMHFTAGARNSIHWLELPGEDSCPASLAFPTALNSA
jgi:hypothetical protein